MKSLGLSDRAIIGLLIVGAYLIYRNQTAAILYATTAGFQNPLTPYDSGAVRSSGTDGVCGWGSGQMDTSIIWN